MDHAHVPTEALRLPLRPARRRSPRAWIATAFLRAIGWKDDAPPPDLRKFVMIAAPHTSNWDGVLLIAFAWRWQVRMRWLIKREAAPFAIAWLLRAMGAVLVDRSSPHGLVADLAKSFDGPEDEEWIVTIPPEGTRSRKESWKSGFYFVAREAKVPICLGFLDYGRKRGGFGPCFRPTDNVVADMDFIRAFYNDIQGCHPEDFTPPLLKEEHGAAPTGTG